MNNINRLSDLSAHEAAHVRRQVIIAGPLPPPLNGFSYITQEMTKILGNLHDVKIIDLSPHKARKGIGYHLQRIWLTLKGTLILIARCTASSRVFYVACEGNLGLIYTLKLTLNARLLRYPIFIHHHSFGYIEKRSRLMAWLVKAAGPRATHIFLCDTMAARFAERYQTPLISFVISNSAFVEPAPPPTAKQEKMLTIGLLSNLNNDKGLSIFLEVLREAARRGMAVSGLLAGPAESDIERDAIDAARGELGSRLNYLGPVYGDAKRDFFRVVDVFVFPTCYANEAQPTVIFEALAHGIPVLSFDRGCICSQVKGHGATLERGGVFVPFAIDWLRERLDAPGTLAQLRLDAHAAFTQDHASARQKAAQLFDTTLPS